VIGIEAIGGIALYTVVEAAAIDVRGDAVEYQVAGHVGQKMHGAVAGESTKSAVRCLELLLQRYDVVEVPLELVLVRVRRTDVGDAD
jgi:hypothetical protein